MMGRPGQSGQITVPNITTLIISSQIGESQKGNQNKKERKDKKEEEKEEDIFEFLVVSTTPIATKRSRGGAIFFLGIQRRGNQE